MEGNWKNPLPCPTNFIYYAKYLKVIVFCPLTYWSTMNHFFLLEVNRLFVMSCFAHFGLLLRLWGILPSALWKNKLILTNYLWSRNEQTTRYRISWSGCCMPRKFGAFDLVDHALIKTNPISKWICIEWWRRYWIIASNDKCLLNSVCNDGRVNLVEWIKGHGTPWQTACTNFKWLTSSFLVLNKLRCLCFGMWPP